jgi:hypothetical protein
MIKNLEKQGSKRNKIKEEREETKAYLANYGVKVNTVTPSYSGITPEEFARAIDQHALDNFSPDSPASKAFQEQVWKQMMKQAKSQIVKF